MTARAVALSTAFAAVLILLSPPARAQDTTATNPMQDTTAVEGLRDTTTTAGLQDTLTVGHLQGQEDSARDANDWLQDHSPRGALWRAAAFPGWGQLYNRQYYKIPIVWAGLGGITATALIVNQRYLLYRHAYHFVAGTNTSEAYEQDYLRLLAELGIPLDRGPEFRDGFRQTRDNLRRNRDLLYIGVGLFYGLAVLDAYVSAHLLDFDVGEDLTLSVTPAPGGFAASVRFAP